MGDIAWDLLGDMTPDSGRDPDCDPSLGARGPPDMDLELDPDISSSGSTTVSGRLSPAIPSSKDATGDPPRSISLASEMLVSPEEASELASLESGELGGRASMLSSPCGGADSERAARFSSPKPSWAETGWGTVLGALRKMEQMNV